MGKPAQTYSIAEWYGRDFASLSNMEIRELASISDPKLVACPFSVGQCSKRGGVCSLRSYATGDAGGGVWIPDGQPVATCPRRFAERGSVIRWVGEALIGDPEPDVVTELPFLSGIAHDGSATGTTVGKIDMVLVAQRREGFDWCAVENQSVYFSGSEMGVEFTFLRSWDGVGTPPPQGRRHPDFRSSGPKRLMPQLQTKVPTISRWGRKTAVIVDLGFWESLSPMEEVSDVSNCDVAWFVVRFDQVPGGFALANNSLHLTTLARAVEGLTAGKPVSMALFERKLGEKLKR